MAQFQYTLIVTTTPSTAATFTPSGGPFHEPVAPGTMIGVVSVEPPTWNGVIAVNAPFAMSGKNVVVGPTPLAAGTYSISGHTDP